MLFDGEVVVAFLVAGCEVLVLPVLLVVFVVVLVLLVVFVLLLVELLAAGVEAPFVLLGV